MICWKKICELWPFMTSDTTIHTKKIHLHTLYINGQKTYRIKYSSSHKCNRNEPINQVNKYKSILNQYKVKLPDSVLISEYFFSLLARLWWQRKMTFQDGSFRRHLQRSRPASVSMCKYQESYFSIRAIACRKLFAQNFLSFAINFFFPRVFKQERRPWKNAEPDSCQEEGMGLESWRLLFLYFGQNCKTNLEARGPG